MTFGVRGNHGRWMLSLWLGVRGGGDVDHCEAEVRESDCSAGKTLMACHATGLATGSGASVR